MNSTWISRKLLPNETEAAGGFPQDRVGGVAVTLTVSAAAGAGAGAVVVFFAAVGAVVVCLFAMLGIAVGLVAA